MSKESCLWLNHIIKQNVFLGFIEYELNSLLGASHLVDCVSVHVQFDLKRYLLNIWNFFLNFRTRSERANFFGVT